MVTVVICCVLLLVFETPAHHHTKASCAKVRVVPASKYRDGIVTDASPHPLFGFGPHCDCVDDEFARMFLISVIAAVTVDGV
jgi:hypothetical protein